MHTLKINLGKHGAHSDLYLDDKKLEGVSYIKIESSVDRATQVTLELFADVEGIAKLEDNNMQESFTK